MSQVKFHGKVLKGEATTSQRALLAKLEGKTNFGKVISKADASRRIDALLSKKAPANGKTKTANKVGDATIGQRVLLARLEGRTNYGQKISFADASRRIAKLLGK